ncbi:MAG TPA: YceI family protein [Candidatus Acidoferrum sp.]|nr:YceI family protein [Candidatus Acidoferrum sp.]
MKRYTLFAGTLTVFLVGAAVTGCGQSSSTTATTTATNVAATAPASAGEMKMFIAKPGSKMRIEGTANIIHPTWQIEGPMIGGWMAVGPGFPTEPGQAATPGKLEATNSVFISVHSLKSVKEDGTPYSDRMDEVMCEHLKEAQYHQVYYHLSQLTLKEAAKSNGAPYVCEAKGDLVIAGVTNSITMPVNITPILIKGDKGLEIKGNTEVKMTDYKVAPVDINLVLGHIKTGDAVKLIFTWIVGEKKPAPPAAAP